jgi:deazaflavin-dependent oxidoreductase (nitroreductase family)
MLISRLTVLFDRLLGRRSYRIHRFLYRHTGGLIGHRTPLGPMLLLTTIGRKSGEARTSPLLYMPDHDDFVVVGSNGGRERPPAWVLNLMATPTVDLQVGRHHVSATAHVLTENQKTVMWPRLVQHYQGWGYYQHLTERELAVVLLVRNREDGTVHTRRGRAGRIDTGFVNTVFVTHGGERNERSDDQAKQNADDGLVNDKRAAFNAGMEPNGQYDAGDGTQRQQDHQSETVGPAQN